MGRPEKRGEIGLPLSNLVATCYIHLFKYIEIKLKIQFLAAQATFQTRYQLYLVNGTTLGSTSKNTDLTGLSALDSRLARCWLGAIHVWSRQGREKHQGLQEQE